MLLPGKFALLPRCYFLWPKVKCTTVDWLEEIHQLPHKLIRGNKHVNVHHVISSS
jgi:hypothetical protein